MMNIIKLSLLVMGLTLAGCGMGGTTADVCPDGDICGDGCMPLGADCCADGSGYCDNNQVCNSSNQCVSSGGGGGGGGGGGSGEVTTCGVCPGDLQCSQVVGCLQSCTCYYTISGSDGTSAWYNVLSACYMCDQVGLGPDCNNAAELAAEAAAAAIASGQCGF